MPAASIEHIILVGCGNMGFAMLSGWLAAGAVKADQVSVVEPNAELRARAASLGIRVLSDPGSLSPSRDVLVVLAVKPQALPAVVPAYAGFAAEGATFLSVAAGVTTKAIRDLMGGAATVVRCMPNTPAAIGEGMMVVYAGDEVAAGVLAFIDTLVAANGRVARIDDEALMDAVTAVSGSGPAYVFHFIECLTDAGMKAGLPDDVARLLAMQTVHGAAKLAAQSEETPARLREQVTSPNGTTAAALNVLMDQDGLKPLVAKAVEAARLRSIELGR